jgi:hypothetical protein
LGRACVHGKGVGRKAPHVLARLRGSNVCLYHQDRGYRPDFRGFHEAGITERPE